MLCTTIELVDGVAVAVELTFAFISTWEDNQARGGKGGWEEVNNYSKTFLKGCLGINKFCMV